MLSGGHAPDGVGVGRHETGVPTRESGPCASRNERAKPGFLEHRAGWTPAAPGAMGTGTPSSEQSRPSAGRVRSDR